MSLARNSECKPYRFRVVRQWDAGEGRVRANLRAHPGHGRRDKTDPLIRSHALQTTILRHNIVGIPQRVVAILDDIQGAPARYPSSETPPVRSRLNSPFNTLAKAHVTYWRGLSTCIPPSRIRGRVDRLSALGVGSFPNGERMVPHCLADVPVVGPVGSSPAISVCVSRGYQLVYGPRRHGRPPGDVSREYNADPSTQDQSPRRQINQEMPTDTSEYYRGLRTIAIFLAALPARSSGPAQSRPNRRRTTTRASKRSAYIRHLRRPAGRAERHRRRDRLPHHRDALRPRRNTPRQPHGRRESGRGWPHLTAFGTLTDVDTLAVVGWEASERTALWER